MRNHKLVAILPSATSETIRAHEKSGGVEATPSTLRGENNQAAAWRGQKSDLANGSRRREAGETHPNLWRGGRGATLHPLQNVL